MPIDVTSRAAFKKAKGPSGEDKLKVLFDTFVARTWWWPKKKLFFYRDPITDEIEEYSKDNFREFLIGEGFFKKFVDSAVKAGGNGNLSDTARAKVEKKAFGNSWIKFCHVVWKTRCVSWVGEIAGYEKGEIRQGNEKLLIQRGPILPVARKGDCSFSITYLKQLHGEAAPYFFAWLKRARESILAQKHSFGHVLVLIGPSSCGKSCCQHAVITPQLGGRSAAVFKQLTGKTPFNKAANASEHNFLDDHSCCDRASQRAMEEAIKRSVSNSTDDTEAKGIDGRTTKCLVRRLSISINDEPHNLSTLPTVRDDNVDKEILIGCRPADILSGLTEQDIARKLKDEEEHVAYWLDHYQFPQELITGENAAEKRTIKRFGFKSYLNPEYLEAINRESPAETLRTLIHAVMGLIDPDKLSFIDPDKRNRKGPPAILHAELKSDPTYGAAVRDLVTSCQYFGTLVSELSKKYPAEFIITSNSRKNSRFYEFQLPK
jgi:hypothetical protein